MAAILPAQKYEQGETQMLPEDIRTTSRRRFLQYCAASPLLASGAFAATALEAPSKLPDPMTWAPPGSIDLIKAPKEAINVFDFEPVARQNVPPAHFGYMASGIDDEVTLRANREDFKKFQLMPHRLNDVSKVDTSIELFGTKYDSPIFVAPTGANQFFHPDGELAVARARAPAIICRCFRPRRTSRSTTSPRRGVRRSGSSSMLRRALRWQRR